MNGIGFIRFFFCGLNTPGQKASEGSPAKLACFDRLQRITGMGRHIIGRLAQGASHIRQELVWRGRQFVFQRVEKFILLQLSAQLWIEQAEANEDELAVQLRCGALIEKQADLVQPFLGRAVRAVRSPFVQLDGCGFATGIFFVKLQNGRGEGRSGDRLVGLEVASNPSD